MPMVTRIPPPLATLTRGWLDSAFRNTSSMSYSDDVSNSLQNSAMDDIINARVIQYSIVLTCLKALNSSTHDWHPSLKRGLPKLTLAWALRHLLHMFQELIDYFSYFDSFNLN